MRPCPLCLPRSFNSAHMAPLPHPAPDTDLSKVSAGPWSDMGQAPETLFVLHAGAGLARRLEFRLKQAGEPEGEWSRLVQSHLGFPAQAGTGLWCPPSPPPLLYPLRSVETVGDPSKTPESPRG